MNTKIRWGKDNIVVKETLPLTPKEQNEHPEEFKWHILFDGKYGSGQKVEDGKVVSGKMPTIETFNNILSFISSKHFAAFCGCLIPKYATPLPVQDYNNTDFGNYNLYLSGYLPEILHRGDVVATQYLSDGRWEAVLTVKGKEISRQPIVDSVSKSSASAKFNVPYLIKFETNGDKTSMSLAIEPEEGEEAEYTILSIEDKGATVFPFVGGHEGFFYIREYSDYYGLLLFGTVPVASLPLGTDIGNCIFKVDGDSANLQAIAKGIYYRFNTRGWLYDGDNISFVNKGDKEKLLEYKGELFQEKEYEHSDSIPNHRTRYYSANASNRDLEEINDKDLALVENGTRFLRDSLQPLSPYGPNYNQPIGVYGEDGTVYGPTQEEYPSDLLSDFRADFPYIIIQQDKVAPFDFLYFQAPFDLAMKFEYNSSMNLLKYTQLGDGKDGHIANCATFDNGVLRLNNGYYDYIYMKVVKPNGSFGTASNVWGSSVNPQDIKSVLIACNGNQVCDRIFIPRGTMFNFYMKSNSPVNFRFEARAMRF